MKKIFGLLVMILVLSISCQKDEETLLDSVLGNWSSQAMNLGGNDVYFQAGFVNNGKYVLSLYNAQTDELVMTLDEALFVVDNDEFQISIEEPDFNQQASGDPIMVTFYVFMSKDKKEMRWFPEDENGETPIIFWTRQ
ncbi:MAG TPA: hypothetical protein DDW27_20710 [Bacteroidales bacterium]|nr:hypothetical protein [Bacteroidales bacterium]